MNPPTAIPPIVLVGDRFDSFVADGLGLTATAFSAAVTRGAYDDLTEPRHVHLGQGLEEPAVTAAAEAVERRGLADRLRVDPRDLPTPVEPRAVHKSDPRNVLIADFEHTGPTTFEASLRLHNDNELVQDHQSGSHLQGMILIEATRQLFLASCELEYLRPWPSRQFSFLLTHTATQFTRPVFPLPLRMQLTTRHAETENVDRMCFTMETRFIQGDRETASSTITVAVRPQEPTRRAELRSAWTAVTALEKARPLAGR